MWTTAGGREVKQLFFCSSESMVKVQNYVKTKRNETGNNHNWHGMRRRKHWRRRIFFWKQFSLGHWITTIAVYSSFSSPAEHLLFHTALNLVISEEAHQSGENHIGVFSFHPISRSHQGPRRRCSAGSSEAVMSFCCFLFPPSDKTGCNQQW